MLSNDTPGQVIHSELRKAHVPGISKMKELHGVETAALWARVLELLLTGQMPAEGECDGEIYIRTGKMPEVHWQKGSSDDMAFLYER